MSAVFQAKKMFLDKGINFEEQLCWYLENGVVLSFKDRFIMAKPIVAKDGDDSWNPKSPDCWYIHCAVGSNCLSWFLEQAPFKLPKLAWKRIKSKDNALRVYNSSTFERFVK
jgi:hypothetical protein